MKINYNDTYNTYLLFINPPYSNKKYISLKLGMIRLNINLVLIRINNFHQSISYGNLKLGITTLVYSLNNL